MHDWSDKSVDWAGISAAAEYIGIGLRRWGRVGVMTYKEKFGTVRVYCSLGWSSLHCMTHPGWAYYRYPFWLASLPLAWLNWGVIPYHAWLYRRYYRKAVQKWPHLRLEILSAADYPELLKGL